MFSTSNDFLVLACVVISFLIAALPYLSILDSVSDLVTTNRVLGQWSEPSHASCPFCYNMSSLSLWVLVWAWISIIHACIKVRECLGALNNHNLLQLLAMMICLLRLHLCAMQNWFVSILNNCNLSLYVCTGLFMIYEEFYIPKYRLAFILLFTFCWSDNVANNDDITVIWITIRHRTFSDQYRVSINIVHAWTRCPADEKRVPVADDKLDDTRKKRGLTIQTAQKWTA